MKVSLFYNSDAGDGVPLDRIRAAIERQGHDVVCVVEKDDGALRLVDEAPDVVVAAGGDGTIALAARLLAHRGIPLAILPLGTANNIATSVGIQGSIAELVSAWNTAGRLPLDLGVADGIDGRRHFVEAVGSGLLPATITGMRARPDRDELPVSSALATALRMTRSTLSRLKPVAMTIVADGVKRVGEFLLVEILNIRSVGANLVFSADADPSDGRLHVVTAGEEHRDEIGRYLEHLLEGRPTALSLPSTPAQHVTVQGAIEVHVDDQLVAISPNRIMSMRIDPGAVELLVGARHPVI